MDYYIRAIDKESLDAALQENEMKDEEEGYILFTDNYALNIIGSIQKTVLIDSLEMLKDVPGYHANLRVLTDSFTISDSLLNMAIEPEPTTPVNVWF